MRRRRRRRRRRFGTCQEVNVAVAERADPPTLLKSVGGAVHTIVADYLPDNDGVHEIVAADRLAARRTRRNVAQRLEDAVVAEQVVARRLGWIISSGCVCVCVCVCVVCLCVGVCCSCRRAEELARRTWRARITYKTSRQIMQYNCCGKCAEWTNSSSSKPMWRCLCACVDWKVERQDRRARARFLQSTKRGTSNHPNTLPYYVCVRHHSPHITAKFAVEIFVVIPEPVREALTCVASSSST
jgi:hypothetical protein